MSRPLESVHAFLGRLKIPDANIRKVKAMNVKERTKTPIPCKINKKKPTDKDYYHTLLLELVRESGRKNYLLVFIRPKNDYDEKGDGKPYIMNGHILGEDTWSTDEEADEEADDEADEEADEEVDEEADEAIDESIDQAANEDHDQVADEDADDSDDQAADERDDRVPDGRYDSTSEDLAYFTADEHFDSDD